jgi:hypothetical protein
MLRSFEARYKDMGSIIICANSDAARRVSALDFAALYGACEISEIAIVDLDVAARPGEHYYPVTYDQGVTVAGYTNVTETLVGVVDVKLERRIKDRRARQDAIMDRRDNEHEAQLTLVAARLCVCIAGAAEGLKACTCKSRDRAIYNAQRDGWWQEIGA